MFILNAVTNLQHWGNGMKIKEVKKLNKKLTKAFPRGLGVKIDEKKWDKGGI